MQTTDAKRVLETALICAGQPVTLRELAALFDGALTIDTIKRLLEDLQSEWTNRGVELVPVASGWRFQSRPEMREFLDRLHPEKPPKYTRAALETLAIIAYHQPVTRAEIEEIRGVSVSRGTVDQLIEMEWVRLGRRKMTPGRPVTFVVTQHFLDNFGLESARDLPGLKELRSAGLLDNRLPPGLGPKISGESDEEDDNNIAQSELFEE